jgi:hypothetical protein
MYMIGNSPFQDAITKWKDMFHAWEIQILNLLNYDETKK